MLELYTTTIEEDYELLRTDKYSSFSNERNVLILLNGEKMVWKFYVDLYDHVCDFIRKYENRTEVKNRITIGICE